MEHIPARPTMYSGVLMRSRLEASYAQGLDARGLIWHHEPMCFAGPDGQYLPDFRIDDVAIGGVPRTVYAEVKPTLGHVWKSGVQRRMRTIWLSDPAAWLLVEVPGEWLFLGQPSWVTEQFRYPTWAPVEWDVTSLVPAWEEGWDSGDDEAPPLQWLLANWVDLEEVV